MAGTKALTKAKQAKKDEFYTQRADIANELRHYRAHFKGKTVLCNCDDPEKSNFSKYFRDNFEFLQLKCLVTTCYRSVDIFNYSDNTSNRGICRRYTLGADGELVAEDIALEGDGDFRSEECIELLKEADIVVTNPPFSLFREYVAQLVKYDKKFLIIGNVQAITYKEFFPLLRDNKVWLGASIHSGDRKFGVPADYPLEASGCGIDENGQRYIRVKGVRWFTNLDYQKRHDKLPLYKKYSPEEFPKYDNYDAINVNMTADIPYDYDGAMGVPITFMDKYNPDQFEIIGLDRYVADKPNYGHRFLMNGKEKFARILIRRKK
ncbi:MAG: adenine-specific methyltransferase EcoRI family protein [Kiritimatiellae bacterium]|nr:adenine-specific methyltransferase EcoRI family protein [Kiritimatiellia bacterium]